MNRENKLWRSENGIDHLPPGGCKSNAKHLDRYSLHKQVLQQYLATSAEIATRGKLTLSDAKLLVWSGLPSGPRGFLAMTSLASARSTTSLESQLFLQSLCE